MSWGIYCKGSKRAVRKFVEDSRAWSEDGPQQEQFQAAKKVILAEIEAAGADILNVEASGHAGAIPDNSRTLRILVEPIVVLPEPSPDTNSPF